jgi:lactate 2-monooxygenase
MSGQQKVQDPGPHARKYGAFQSEIYAAGMFKGIKPTVTTDPAKLEAQAKNAMTASAYAYVAGGAGERATMDANRLALRQWKIVPKMLRPTTHRDMSVELWGHKYDSPVVASPIGVQGIFHPDGECGVAEVCGQIGVPYVTSTASSHTIEEIAKANGEGNPRWFQLYWPQHKLTTESLLKRAKEANYRVLVVTLDTWALAWRPW